MTKFLFLVTLYLSLINLSFSQYKHPLIENVEIELEQHGVKKNFLDGAKLKCSKTLTGPDETRFRVYFSAKFYDFSTKKTLEFNNITVVDVDNKIRYRPDGVIQYGYGFSNGWFAAKIELIENEDPFIKYSQNGIENFDFYSETLVDNLNEKYRYRLKPEAFKSNNLKLTFSFPIFKTQKDSGNFKIYWKDKVIGEFKIKDGVPVQ
jgi:hypothetical protein